MIGTISVMKFTLLFIFFYIVPAFLTYVLALNEDKFTRTAFALFGFIPILNIFTATALSVTYTADKVNNKQK